MIEIKCKLKQQFSQIKLNYADIHMDLIRAK